MRAGMQEAYVSKLLLIYFVSGPVVYSQTKWRVPLKITFMDWLMEKFIEPTWLVISRMQLWMITGILNPLVVPKVWLMGLMLKNSHLNKILILEMIREFNISIINSLLHSWSNKQIQHSNNQFINVILRDMLHLVACNCLATNLIAMHTSFVVAGEAHMGVTWVEFLGWFIILQKKNKQFQRLWIALTFDL